jgi:hypothetical protein
MRKATLYDAPIKREYYKISHVANAAKATVSEINYLLKKEVISYDTTTLGGKKLFVHSNVKKIINLIILKRTTFFSMDGLTYFYKTGYANFKLPYDTVYELGLERI